MNRSIAPALAAGVWLHATEHHAHGHVHEPVQHSHRHAHFPDIHHRHEHAPTGRD